MLIKKIICLLIISFQAKCQAEIPTNQGKITGTLPQPLRIKPNALKCGKSFNWFGFGKNKTKNFGLEMQLPFMDMLVENERNVFVLNLPKEQLMFVLHGNELYQLLVGSEEKKLLFIGWLNGAVKDHELLGADAMQWHNYLILVVALPDHIDVYQISLTRIAERASIATAKLNTQPAIKFDLIQQLIMPGKYQNLNLVKLEDSRVLLVVAVNFTKLYGKLRTYEWQHTYFDPIEELTVPQMHIFQLIGQGTKYLITGRAIRLQEKSIITVYEFQPPTLNLRNIQTLTVGARVVHVFTFRDRNYLVACTAKQKKKCNSFRMADKQFQLYKERSEMDYAFDKLVGGEYFLVGVRREMVKLFSTARLDCYGSFATNETEVNAILIHKNGHGENFFLLHYKRPFRSLIRMVAVEVKEEDLLGIAGNNSTDTDDLAANEQQHLFENSIAQLRSLLLKRKPVMDVLRRVSAAMQPKLKYLETKQPVTMHAGNIGIIKLVGRNLESPLQLLERVHNLRNSRGRKRAVRAINSRTNTRMPMNLKLQKLRVDNLIYDGPILPGWQVNKQAKPLPTLRVERLIKTKRMEVNEMVLPAAEEDKMRQRNTESAGAMPLKVRELNVESINGIQWRQFYDELFLKNRDKHIKGRLVLQAPTKIDYLETPLLNGLKVDQLFNLHQPQVIHSNIVLNGFFVKDMTAERVNGLDFANDIVFRGQNSVIETPVSIFHVSVAGDLVLGERIKQQRQANADNLQQQYTGKVIINGTLTVNNLIRDLADETQLLVAEKPLSQIQLMENYLLKHVEQEFLQPIKFENAMITTPSFQTEYLNNHPVKEHLLNHLNQTVEQPLYIVFMNASIAGDLLCKNYSSKLHVLSKNVVRHGDVANITGTKIFESLLTIDNALTLSLNDHPVKDFVLKSELEKDVVFEGNKTFKSIEVSDAMDVSLALQAKLLNNLPLSELLKRDYHLDRLEVAHKLQTLNMVFHKINGVSFDDVWTKFNIKGDQLVLHKDLIIEGNVQFNENLMLQRINDIDWAAYVASLVRVHENAQISGEKTFMDELTITKQLQSPLLNNADFSAVLQQLLTKSTPQVISGNYSFDHLVVTNLDVSVINELPTASFIDTRAIEIIIESELTVEQLHVDGNMEGQFNEGMPFQDIEDKLRHLTQYNWRNLIVHGNVRWEEDSIDGTTQYDLLNYLYKNAVRRDVDQVISGNVRLQRPLISNMVTSTAFPKNVDLEFIARDCLLKNTTAPQHIISPKWFVKPLHMQHAEVEQVLHAKLLNNIDILKLNSSIYRMSSNLPIIGPLNFRQPPSISNLLVNGTVNGVDTAKLYRSSANILPPVKINSLVIDNELVVGDINDMSLKYLLENRITKNSSALEVFGHLKFENLVLNKQVRMQSINDIPIDDLVFKHSTHLQAIESAKQVVGNLTLAGPAHVLRLNGNDLVALHQKSIFIDRAQTLNNLIVEQVTFEAGIQFNDSQLHETHKMRIKLNALRKDLQDIDIAIDKSMQTSHQSSLYLDYDLNKMLLWQKPNDTIRNTSTFVTDQSQHCALQLLLIEKTKNNELYYLSNRTTNLLTAQANDLYVKVENFCKLQFRKIKSKITITSGKVNKVIGMKKTIAHIEYYQLNGSAEFVLLHALGDKPKHHEIRVLKIDQEASAIRDWQAISEGVGKIMKLCNLNGRMILITSGVIANQPIINIYDFNESELKFKLLQTIAGDYNFIELLMVSGDSYHLILSSRFGQRISIYEYTPNAAMTFTHYQTLQLTGVIDKMNAFLLSRTWYLMTSYHAPNNVFYLTIYEWTVEAAWQENISGFFPNVQLAVPLVENQKLPLDQNALLLICGVDECRFVKAIVAH